MVGCGNAGKFFLLFVLHCCRNFLSKKICLDAEKVLEMGFGFWVLGFSLIGLPNSFMAKKSEFC